MQRNRKDSEDFSTEESAANLDESFVSELPEIRGSQKSMLMTFMIIQILQTILTVSLGPLYAIMATTYGVSHSKVHLLYGLSTAACVIAFYPTNALIGKYGIKLGLTISMIGATVGGVLCCFINKSYDMFLIGYFLM
jgi:MFS family permease